MIRFLKAAVAFLPIFAAAQNRVLMVDEMGKINIPEVIVTTAQWATNASAVAIADAKAEAAYDAAVASSNLVEETVTQITEGQLTVYRDGFIDSFTSDTALPKEAKMLICKFQPNVGTDGIYNVHLIEYAVTHDAGNISPDVLFCRKLEEVGGRDGMLPLSPERIEFLGRLPKSFTDSKGNSYPYVYGVRVRAEKSTSAFFCVYLSGDDAACSAVLEISGGISGGKSAVVEWGGNRLTFTGGLLTGVEVLP